MSTRPADAVPAPPGLRPCVLLIEDNDPLRLWAEMALEERALDVVGCPRVAQARDVLARRPVDLVITDLMLPGESGLEFVQSLRAGDDGFAALPVVVFTAGATQAQQAALTALGVSRIVAKPASVETLLAAVDEVLGATAAPARTPAAFGGDAALYRAYLASCREQFIHDMATGDRAAAAGDLAAMRLLAHSLKSVLISLDEADAGAVAKDIELRAADGDAAAFEHWPALREALARLRRG